MDSIISINQPAPDFALSDLDGENHQLTDWRGRIVILVFWSAECPWSGQTDKEINDAIRSWGEKVIWCSIASNANEPVELLQQVADQRKLPLLLYDPLEMIADLYGAQTTPHVYVVDEKGILRYQGAVNDRTFRKRQPSRFYLRDAVEALLAGHLPELAETAPYGCTLVRFNE
jgi:peroxiredoxin